MARENWDPEMLRFTEMMEARAAAKNVPLARKHLNVYESLRWFLTRMHQNYGENRMFSRKRFPKMATLHSFIVNF